MGMFERWRKEDGGEETEGVIELLCDAQDEIVKLRAELVRTADAMLVRKVGTEWQALELLALSILKRHGKDLSRYTLSALGQRSLKRGGGEQ